MSPTIFKTPEKSGIIRWDMNAQASFVDGVQTVMVVDNSADLRLLASTILETQEVNVITASGGQEALDLVLRGCVVPDLILTDMFMPGMDGAELCSKLKQSERTELVPVILMSGMDGIEDRAIEIGASGYLKKPYDIEALTDLVKSYLS